MLGGVTSGPISGAQQRPVNSKSECARVVPQVGTSSSTTFARLLWGFWYIFEGSFRVDVNSFTVDLNDQFPERGMQQGYSCNFRVCTERVTTDHADQLGSSNFFSRHHHWGGRSTRGMPADHIPHSPEFASRHLVLCQRPFVGRADGTSNVVMSTSSKKTRRRLRRLPFSSAVHVRCGHLF